MSDIKYPKGYNKGGDKVQTAVRFDQKLFKAIIAMAKKEKPAKDFNEMVIYLVQCGKLCLEESDKMEEAA